MFTSELPLRGCSRAELLRWDREPVRPLAGGTLKDGRSDIEVKLQNLLVGMGLKTFGTDHMFTAIRKNDVHAGYRLWLKK